MLSAPSPISTRPVVCFRFTSSITIHQSAEAGQPRVDSSSSAVHALGNKTDHFRRGSPEARPTLRN